MITDKSIITLQHIWYYLQKQVGIDTIYWDHKKQTLVIKAIDDQGTVLSIGQLKNEPKFYINTRFYALMYKGDQLPPATDKLIHTIAQKIEQLENKADQLSPVQELSNYFEKKSDYAEISLDFLKPILKQEQWDKVDHFVHITPVFKKKAASALTEIVLRINESCNQRCQFCLLKPNLPPLNKEQILSILESFPQQFKRIWLSLSGGEPTLDPQLLEYIQKARSLSYHHINIQTNGVALSDGNLINALPSPKRLSFLISFNGATEETYDQVTQTKHLFPRVQQTIILLLKKGFLITLNYVVNAHNYKEMEAFVILIHQLIQRAGLSFYRRFKIQINFSTLSWFETLEENEELLVRFTEVLKEFEKAKKQARQRWILIENIVGSGYCNIPLCIGSKKYRNTRRLRKVSQDIHLYYTNNGTINEAYDRIKKEECRACPYDLYCPGLMIQYAKKFSLEEIGHWK